MGTNVSISPKLTSLLNKGIGTRGDYTSKQLNQLAQEIADLTGYDQVTVRKFLRNKAFQTGGTKTLNVIRQLLEKSGVKPNTQLSSSKAEAQPKVPAKNIDLLLHEVFNIKSELQKQKAQIFAQAKNPSPNFKKDTLQQFASQLTKSVTSPREFASLLVNNKALFILLKSNPAAFSSIITASNPNINFSPAMLSEMSKFIANILKVKQGKTKSVEEDEQLELDRQQEAYLDENDHQNALVKNIRGTIENMPISRLRDFLMEAERFAEEEIANMWSLTLKKEKQLEKLLGKMPGELKHMVEAFPHADPQQLLKKFQEIQSKKKTTTSAPRSKK